MLGRVFRHGILQRLQTNSGFSSQSFRKFTSRAHACESFKHATQSRRIEHLEEHDNVVGVLDDTKPRTGLSGSHLGRPARFAKAASMHRALIAFGSNMGHRVSDIERALMEMDKRRLKIKSVSRLYETEPMYVTDQDVFLNGACEVSETVTVVDV
jgi:hypothetical protein